MSALTVALVGIAMIVSVTIATWFLTRRQPRRATVITGSPLVIPFIRSDATEPFLQNIDNASGTEAQTAQLHLVKVEGETASHNAPLLIDLHGVERIGRDRQLVNTVIDDRRVSRLHCRISVREGRAFYIYDEGSTNGTFVNGKEVEIAGQILLDGDEVTIGPATYRYSAVQGEGNNVRPVD